jgi:DNA-binding transcriptional regulator of glucitol operon
MKSEHYEAVAFAFAWLVLTALTWWRDREHQRTFHTPEKGGAVSIFNLDEPK